MSRAVVLVLLLMTVVGCAGSGRAPSTPTASVLDGCVRPGDGGTVVRLATGAAPASGVLLGSGHRGVVLSHQSDGDLCQLLPYARTLAAQGFLVLDWDAGVDPVGELAGPVLARMRRAGATQIALVGASMGAKQSLIAASRAGGEVDAVVALSAESTLGETPVAPAVARLRAPVLLVTSTGDPFGSSAAATTFLRVCPSRHKQLLRVPGSEHGIDLLAGAHRTQVTAAVLSFLNRYD